MLKPDAAPVLARRYFAVVLGLTFARLVAAFLLPLVSDEAYYILWVKNLAWGYYDHPPMVAWLEFPLSALPWLPVGLYRIVPTLVVVVVAEGLRRLVASAGESRARLISLAYLSSPQAFWHVVVTPEYALLAAIALVAWLYTRALASGRAWDYLACGLLVGSAALSKLLAVLIVPGMVLYSAYVRPRRWFPGLVLIAAGAVPGLCLLLGWNATHCWANFLIHLRRVSPETHVDVVRALKFLLAQVLLLTPWIAWMVARAWTRGSVVPGHQGRWLFLPALIVLLVYGATNEAGAHWLVAFFPLIFPLLAVSDERTLGRVVWANLALAATVGVCAAVLAVVAPPRLKGWRYYHDLVLSLDGPGVCREMEAFGGAGAELATFDYSQASVLSLACGRNVHVVDNLGNFGRAFDEFTDFRALDGKHLVVLRQVPIDPGAVGGALSGAKHGRIERLGREFHLVTGTFSYARYRPVLSHVAGVLYPCASLPVFGRTGSCFFHRRYFPSGPPCGFVSLPSVPRSDNAEH